MLCWRGNWGSETCLDSLWDSPFSQQLAVVVILKLVKMFEVAVMKTATSICARSFTYLFHFNCRKNKQGLTPILQMKSLTMFGGHSFESISLLWPPLPSKAIKLSLWKFSSLPGIEPVPSAMRTQNPNHWTAREFPLRMFSYHDFAHSDMELGFKHRLIYFKVRCIMSLFPLKVVNNHIVFIKRRLKKFFNREHLRRPWIKSQ